MTDVITTLLASSDTVPPNQMTRLYPKNFLSKAVYYIHCLCFSRKHNLRQKPYVRKLCWIVWHFPRSEEEKDVLLWTLRSSCMWHKLHGRRRKWVILIIYQLTSIVKSFLCTASSQTSAAVVEWSRLEIRRQLCVLQRLEPEKSLLPQGSPEDGEWIPGVGQWVIYIVGV